MSIIPFTNEQTAVRDHRQGHALVSAVAGSGKTEVLVARTVDMMQEGVDSESVLILMFNKSAQEVFQDRLQKSLPDAKVYPSVLTFHALGLRILDIWYDRKRAATPQLHDDDTTWLMMLAPTADLVNQQFQAGINTHPDQLRKYLAAFDFLKNMDYPHKQVDWDKLGWTTNFTETVQTLFIAFEEQRCRSACMGLNDLLYDAVQLLRNEPDYADEWRGSIDHIMVDEYQDSNPLQHWILRTFTHEQSSVMVVGDEDQCIYTWRAADPDMMVRGFEAQYPNVVRYTLSRTFRYGHAVALMANHVLQYNKVRPDKMVISGINTTGNIEVVRGQDTRALLPVLQNLRSTDAILVREFRHAEDIEFLMQWHNLPYMLEGAALFPNRSTGLVLRMCLGCVLEKPYKPTIEQARAWIRWLDPEASGLFVEYLSKDMNTLGVERGIRNAMSRDSLSIRQQNHLVQMLVFNGRLRDTFTQPEQMATVRRLMIDAWSRTIEKLSDRRALPLVMNVLELTESESLSKIISFLDTWQACTEGPLLTSIHRAKGGGWPRVVLPHTETELFPSEVSEEERRLFYVALTRAKEELVLFTPFDVLRDAMWKNPLEADLKDYIGPTGRFLLESYPEYALKLSRTWLSTDGPSQDILTPVARRYEAILYPGKLKSSNLWSKLNF